MMYKLREVVAKLLHLLDPWSAESILKFEGSLHQAVAKDCVDPIVGHLLQAGQDAEAVRAAAAVVVASRPHARLQKRDESVTIRLLGGSQHQVVTPYYLRRPPGEGLRVRGPRGNGFYPRLEVLGVHDRVTPALASEVARNLAAAPLDEAVRSMAARGLAMDRKAASRIAQNLAKRGLDNRDQLASGLAPSDEAAGTRLVIGVDGGRLRTRVTRNVGRRRKSGRRGYDGVWREPKVLTIYEIDEHGRKRRQGVCRYDATMRDADGVFGLLVGYLVSIGADLAAEWIVVGDGAGWIWDRVGALADAVGFDKERVTEVVDFYHAVQRLHTIAGQVRGWGEAQAKAWVANQTKLLKAGDLGQVIRGCEALCRGRFATKTRRLIQYLRDHRSRMRYRLFRRRRIPLGSGSIPVFMASHGVE